MIRTGSDVPTSSTAARSLLLAAGAALIALAAFGWQRIHTIAVPSAVAAGLPASALDGSTISFRVRFGMTDTAPGQWDGSLAVTAGEILELRNWHPRPEDKISGKDSWTLSTRKGPNYNWRAWEQEPSIPPESYLLIPGIIVDVRAASGTTVRIQTKNGEFQFRPFELSAGRAEPFLDGRVLVDRVPTASLLSTSEQENDFAVVAAGPSGELWTAWIAYRGGANRVLARRFNGKSWDPALVLSEQPGDIFLVKLGRDGKGHLWAVWSARSGGNWDLYGRRFDGGSWSAATRLTNDPQPDIYHNLAMDSSGALWLVWQGYRGGKSTILTRRLDGGSWSAPEEVAGAAGNCWEPAVATDGAGRVYVAWDTYAKGNYDVMMRQFERGRWSDPVAIAATPKFEAHVSLACDDQNRLWAAWNESGQQWGKDTGFLVLKQGTRLYQWRSVAVAVLANGAWHEPAADFAGSLPEDLQGYNDLPSLQSDGRGRVWLFFRHRTLRIRDVPSDTPAHRAAWEIFGTFFEGERWQAPLAVPFSQGRMDMRAGFSCDGRGNIYAAWATDNRDFEEFLFQHADVYTARVPPVDHGALPPKLAARAAPELREFPIHLQEAGDLTRIRNYEIRSGGKTFRIYRGDTHRHTEFSMDGNNDGSLLQAYRYAIDAASLDFLGVSDHNGSGGPDVEYINWLLQQMADVFHLPGTFAPLFGYERSVSYPNGHRNIMFAERGIPTLPIPGQERQGKSGAAALYEYLKRNRGLVISHTSASSMGTDWRDNDPEVEPLVEIYQGDRVSAEYEGAPKAANGGNPISGPGGFRPAGYVWNAWAKGYRLGTQASSDHLSTHISYACTIAEDFSRGGLLDAMRKRHSYGATDNIILDYRLQTAGAEHLQGDIVDVSGEFHLWVQVIGTAPIRQIDIIKNNRFIHNLQPLEREVRIRFADTDAGPGESYYYVRVIQVDDQMAWSSPIWVRR